MPADGKDDIDQDLEPGSIPQVSFLVLAPYFVFLGDFVLIVPLASAECTPIDLETQVLMEEDLPNSRTVTNALSTIPPAHSLEWLEDITMCDESKPHTAILVRWYHPLNSFPSKLLPPS